MSVELLSCCAALLLREALLLKLKLQLASVSMVVLHIDLPNAACAVLLKAKGYFC